MAAILVSILFLLSWAPVLQAAPTQVPADSNASKCRWPLLASLPRKEADWWKEREQGWFFYRREPEACEARLDAITPDLLRAMPAKEFRRLMDELMDYAVSNPDTRNVRAYMIAQWIARERAVKFMNAWSDVLQAHPALDYTVVRPPSAFAGTQKALFRGRERERFLEELGRRKDAAVVAFVSPDCVYCATQIPILFKLRDKYGIRLRLVNLREHPEMIQRLGLEATPEVWLAVRGKGMTRVTAGLRTLDVIEEAIVRAWSRLTGRSPYEPVWKKEGVEAVFRNENLPMIRPLEGGF